MVEYESTVGLFGVREFTGTVRKYDLYGELLQERFFKDGISYNNKNSRVADFCTLNGFSKTCMEEMFDGWDHTTGAPIYKCGRYVIYLTFDCPEEYTPNNYSSYGTYVADYRPSLGGGSGTGTVTNINGTYDPLTETTTYQVDDPWAVVPPLPTSEEILQVLVDQWELDQIDDTQLKPCMQTILTSLKSLTQGSVGQIIQKFSGSVPGWNWKVKDGILSGGQNAITSQAYHKLSGTVTTTFDGSRFASASDLSVARSLLHESIHAYLITFANVDPVNVNKTFPDMVQDYMQQKYGSDSNQIQHAEFVRNYVNDIALVLKEFGTGKGYNLSDQFYLDLAWGGLTHTGKYDSLGNPIETTWFINSVPNLSDRQRITSIIAVEQTGKDISGNVTPKKGNNAGC